MREPNSRDPSPLDPRRPLVINTRPLGRRPGAMRSMARSVPAPAHLGVDVLAVPEGSSLELELRLESVMEGVLVSGTVAARLEGECVRCLDPIARSLRVDVQELFVYPDVERDDDEDHELHVLEGDLLDLEPALRDAVVLALPFQPHCSADCPGLCPQCGARLADDPAHDHPSLDARWAALTSLTGIQVLEPHEAPPLDLHSQPSPSQPLERSEEI